MEAANSVDLSQFRRWYAQAGTPVLKVQQSYDPSAQTLTLTINQHCPSTPGQAVKEPLHIPVTAGLINKDGSVAPLYRAGLYGVTSVAQGLMKSFYK